MNKDTALRFDSVNRHISDLYTGVIDLRGRLRSVDDSIEGIYDQMNAQRRTQQLLGPVLVSLENRIKEIGSRLDTVVLQFGGLHDRINERLTAVGQGVELQDRHCVGRFNGLAQRLTAVEEHPLGLDLNDYALRSDMEDIRIKVENVNEYASEDWASLDRQVRGFQSRLDTMTNNPEYNIKALADEVSRLRGELAGLYLRTDGGLNHATIPTTIEVDGQEAVFVPVSEEDADR